MLSFLRARDPPRTKIASLTTFAMENGRSSVSFANAPHLTSAESTIAFTLPPREPGPNPRDNSIMIPPFHIHPRQQEIFLVTAGTALFNLNRAEVPVAAGDQIVIPAGEYHRFRNASPDAPMSLEARFDPAERRREERFFRNLCGYLTDASAGGTGMLDGVSVPQLALFAWEADMAICEPMVVLGVPKSIGGVLSIGLTWVLGVFVGKWMLGYQASYEEYFHESSE